MASYGYSRDKRPDKLQINFGIATRINGIPTAITIQKGNTQDKKHMREMLRLVTAILPGGSLLIFDTGANTLENKQKIRDQGFQFLTLKAKNVGSYQRYLRFFHHEGTTGNVTMLMVNDRQYIWPKRKKKMAASPTSSSHQSCTMNRCRSKRRSSNEKNNRATYY